MEKLKLQVKIGDKSQQVSLNVRKFAYICRSCMIIDQNVYNFFQTKVDEEYLCDIYTTVTSIGVSPDDGLPQNLCYTCLLKIIDFYNFKSSCLQIEDKLIDMKYIYSQQNQINKTDEDENMKEDVSINEAVIVQISESNNILSSDETEDMKLIQETDTEESNQKLNRDNKSQLIPCPVCENMFNSISEFDQHRRKTGHKFKQVCNICKKEVTKMGAHMLSHSKEKRFQCSFCGERFTMKYNLNRHTMRHTGERPFSCQTCGRGFIQAVQLSEHKKSHTGEKPFICEICGKKFASSHSYKYHIKKHCEEKEMERFTSLGKAGHYICDLCDEQFLTKKCIKKHFIKHTT